MLSYNQHRNAEPRSPRGGSNRSGSPDALSREPTEAAEAKPEEKVGKDSAAKAMLRDEFLINMQKFASSITRTIQQIEGEVSIHEIYRLV